MKYSLLHGRQKELADIICSVSKDLSYETIADAIEKTSGEGKKYWQRRLSRILSPSQHLRISEEDIRVVSCAMDYIRTGKAYGCN